MKMLLIEKAKNTKEMTNDFKKIINKIDKNDKETLKNIIMQVYSRKMNREDFEVIIKEIDGGDDKMMAVFEMIEKENQSYINQGKKEGYIEVAKKMLKMKMPIDTIMKVTKLSKKEIEKLEK